MEGARVAHGRRINKKDALKTVACAIIEQAVNDIELSESTNTNVTIRNDAVHFLFSSRLEMFIEEWRLDLNADYVRRAVFQEKRQILEKNEKYHEVTGG